MPRPATRTRILSAGAGAAATVAALSLVLSPPTDVDPLGALGRANASSAAAPGATGRNQPSAFGVPGVDLGRLGYSGPDLDDVTLDSLSKPFSDLPTERAADIRDRINAAVPHLQGLHQAKNLLQRALPRQDHHVNAGKVAIADAEAALVEARDGLAVVRAQLDARAAGAQGDHAPDEGGPDERTPDQGRPPAPPSEVPATADDRPAPGVEVPADDKVEGQGQGKAEGKAEGQGKAAANGKGQPAGKNPADGKAAPGGKTPGGTARATAGAPAEGKAAVGSKPDAGPGYQAMAAPAVPPARSPVPVPEVEPVQSPVEQVAALVARAKAEAGVARAEQAVARVHADLEARKARRRAFREAAATAEHEVWRIDAHVRWLEYELWLAQAHMPSAGNWLVLEERKDAETPIVEVRGIRVHRSLADSVRQLVDAAATVGIDLRGTAYRPVSRQIELRRQNCGPTDFDIFEKSSSLCSPPTAKPGRSLHEMGLAIDLQNGENPIVSRRDPAYGWLAANAPAYGLYNLPAEPWHWSATGQ